MSETIIAQQASVAAQSLGALFAAFEAISGQQKEKSEALQTASAATLSKKEELYCTAADMAFKASWVDDACEGAITMALAARGEAQKLSAVKTFASELRLAMHSRVRQAVPQLFTLGREAWAEEQAALKVRKDAPAPLSTAWARCTHMLIACMRDIKEHQGNTFPDKASLIAFGIANDPATDDEKIAKKLKTLVKTFDAFHAEFPVDAFKSITQYLKLIDAKTLREARAKAKPAATPAPAPSNLRKAEPAPEPASDAPSDVIAQFNNLTNAA
jgi:hypothetical protein